MPSGRLSWDYMNGPALGGAVLPLLQRWQNYGISSKFLWAGLQAMLLMVLAWSLVQFFWVLSEPLPRPVLARSSSQGTTESQARDLAASLRYDPFFSGFSDGTGTSASASAALPFQGVDIPETGLRIVLIGARARLGGGGTAIIKLPTGGQRIVQIGDELLSGVRIRAIQPGRVILEHRGRLEALNFFEDGGVLTMTGPGLEVSDKTNGAPVAANNPAVSSQNTEQDRIFVDVQPERFAAAIQLRPRVEGQQVTGYHILPGADRGLFDQAGLKLGDILVAVDGVSDLTDQQALFERLSGQDEIGMILERGGERRRVIVEFGG